MKRRGSGMGGDRFRNLVLALHCKAAQLFHDCLCNLAQLKVLLPQTLKTKHHVGRCSSGSKGHDRVMVRGTSGDRTTTSEQILQKLQKKTATSKVFQELLRIFLNHCGTQS